MVDGTIFLYGLYWLTSVYIHDILCISDIYNIQTDIGRWQRLISGLQIMDASGLEVGYGLRKCDRNQESDKEV